MPFFVLHTRHSHSTRNCEHFPEGYQDSWKFQQGEAMPNFGACISGSAVFRFLDCWEYGL